MLGTIINTITILAGSTFGALVRTGIGEKYKKALFDGLGLCCLVLGMNASLPNMAKSEFPVLFILSLAIGGLIGTKLDLAGRVDRLNARLNAKSNKENNSVQGLVTGCLLYCIGTFSIVGPVLSALSPTQGWAWNESANTFLYTNATLDFVSSAVLAASYGWIMLLAAPVLFCWQGLFYAIGCICGDGMPEPMRVELSIVGGVLIISSGLSILGIKDCKTVNLLPSLLVPVVFYLIKMLF
ncbi:MAG: DUF554 domain-containing protein [Bacteroidaceae bacterium]|nr:DUF554 domain-containing protein [Bacteroidaceae bacterium]